MTSRRTANWTLLLSLNSSEYAVSCSWGYVQRIALTTLLTMRAHFSGTSTVMKSFMVVGLERRRIPCQERGAYSAGVKLAIGSTPRALRDPVLVVGAIVGCFTAFEYSDPALHITA